MDWLGTRLVVAFAALVTYFLRSSIRPKNRLSAHGLRTFGTVTGPETSSEAEGGITYCLLVQFMARNDLRRGQRLASCPAAAGRGRGSSAAA